MVAVDIEYTDFGEDLQTDYKTFPKERKGK
jgi:hypothetical protein